VARLAALGFVTAVVVAMALNPGRPIEPFRAAADEIPIPMTWTLLAETVRSDAGAFGCGFLNPECPGLVRQYSVTGETPIAARVGDPIRQRFRAAGWATTGGWSDPCPTRQIGDSCVFAMGRGAILARVFVQAPAEISTSNGGLLGQVSVTISYGAG
jgi:hypothetical protein